jgi:DNA polymerase-1
MLTALIDGDIYNFTASSANEYECQWDMWLWTLHADFAAAAAQFDNMVHEVVEGIQADKIIIALTDPDNFRKRIMPSYKSNRTGKRKPVVYAAMREYIEEKYTTFQRPGLEGDDVLGILSTHPNLVDGEKIIVSIDKDFHTIPGKLLNDRRARKRVDEEGVAYTDCIEEITVDMADHYHLLQTLTGDVTDGYPGCPGVGAVRAAALLEGGKVLEREVVTISRGPRKGEQEERWEPGRDGTPWEIIVSAYASAGLSEEVALQNARVARICRYTDYNYETKKVIGWRPKK